ncbi:MAG: glycosyltransferase family 2 protein [Thalassotalea sp.]|nr:glycosyltransferase family 2 protein [Thalassotalea sp.]
MYLLMSSLFFLLSFLVIYHHVIYPLMLRAIASRKTTDNPEITQRKYQSSKEDKALNHFSIVIPAYNEAEFIAEKIRNLGFLDYPSEQFELVLLCDGCKDDTYSIAVDTLKELGCSELNYQVINFDQNRGKVAVLKDGIARAKFENIVFSDVSALLPVNSLLMLDAHFNNADVGAVSAGYRFAKDGTVGEQKYWQYQRKVRQQESSVGSVLGAHGAFYAIRKACFEEIPAHTINDDFLIPMNVIKQGYRVIYDARVAAIELEQVNLEQDMKRRLRIAAGNFQQMLMLMPLLNPKYGWNAVNFASGKVLRALVPFFLVFIFFSNIYLIEFNWIFQVSMVVQVALYGGVYLMTKSGCSLNSSILKLLCYLVNGYWVALLGSVKYVLGLQGKVWSKI